MFEKTKILVIVFSVLTISACFNDGGITDNRNFGLMGGSIQGRVLNLTAAVTTFAGTAGAAESTDGTGTAARFRSPSGITTDGTNLYVADANNHTIRQVVIATGVVTTLAGTAGAADSTDGTGAAARFRSPTGITTDGTNLYVADSSNHTIRQIVIATGVVTTLAGTAGVNDFVDGTGPAARFADPYAITTDGTNLYVTDDSNNAIRQIVIATGVVTTLAGGTAGSADGTGAAAQFDTPDGITTDGTNLYVADSGNHTIRQVVIATAVVTTLAGTPGVFDSTDGTGATARFYYPYGITTDGINLYVVEYSNYTIRKIVIATGVVTTLAGTALSSGFTDGTGAAALFSDPEGITNDNSSLFVADTGNHTIRKVD